MNKLEKTIGVLLGGFLALPIVDPFILGPILLIGVWFVNRSNGSETK